MENEAISKAGNDPVVMNYWLSRGLSDYMKTVEGSLAADHKDYLEIRSDVSEAVDEIPVFRAVLPHVVGSLRFVASALTTTTLAFFHGAAALALSGGSLATMAVMRFSDGLYRRVRRVGFVCDRCKGTHAMPGYVCPGCGKTHTRLVPGRAGIFCHRCECGQLLPSTFFISVKDPVSGDFKKRAQLEQCCPNPECGARALPGDFRTMSISIVGGRSAGKTAYLAAVAHDLLVERQKDNDCEMTLAGREKERLFEKLERFYSTGKTKQTVEAADPLAPSAVSLSFSIQAPGLKPDRMVHIYDVAGESFLRGEEHEAQLQYSYEQGAVLVVDPMSIAAVRGPGLDGLSPEDRCGVAQAEPYEVLSGFVAKVQSASAADYKSKLRLPLAVVVGKIDQPGISRFFDEGIRSSYKAAHPGCPDADVSDALVRKFLTDHGLGNFVTTVQTYFENYRFFAVSSMGHATGKGRFTPVDVIDPIAWIVRGADPALADSLGLPNASGLQA